MRRVRTARAGGTGGSSVPRKAAGRTLGATLGLPSIATSRTKGVSKGPSTPKFSRTKGYEVRKLCTGKPRVRLPQREEDSGKLCVVLDMDETLIHSIFSDPGNVYRQAEARKNASSDDVESFELLMEDGDRATVNLRPGLKEFLEQGAEHFELMVFTAGLKCYAQPLLNVIDPGGAAFRARLFRGSCTQVPGVGFVKDLALANRDPGRVVLVDNNPISCVPQPDNGIPIASFFDDKDDRALEELLALLISLKDVKDVRPALRKKFGLRRELAGYDRMMKASSPSSVTSFGDVLF